MLVKGWRMARRSVEALAAGAARVRRGRAVARPSLLDRVRLADGRLAWPVAVSLGICEATFRKRLRHGLSPDEATFRPLGPATRGRRVRRPWLRSLPFDGLFLADGSPLWLAVVRAGLKPCTVRHRLERGLSPDEAVTFKPYQRRFAGR